MQKNVRMILAVTALVFTSEACRRETSKKVISIQTIEESDSKVRVGYDISSDLLIGLEGTQKEELETLKSSYESCSETGRNASNAQLVLKCSQDFNGQLNGFLDQLTGELLKKNDLRRSSLDSAELLAQPEHEEIKVNLAKIWDRYQECQNQALELEDATKAASQLKGCEVTVDLDLKSIDHSIRSIGINVLDTW